MKTLAAQIRGGLRVGRDGAAVARRQPRDRRLRPRTAARLRGARRTRAGSATADEGVDVAFVSNVDPEHLTRALAPLDPATTLFIVTSKTFTTGETLANAREREGVARRALGAAARSARISSRSPATPRRHTRSASRGADVLPLWDWVGGRYSLWSPAGLPIAIKLGWDTLRRTARRRRERRSSISARRRSSATCRWCWRSPAGGMRAYCGNPSAWSSRMRGAGAAARLPAAARLESNGKRVARDGGALAARRAGAVGRDRAPTASTRSSSGCIRAREAPVEFIVPVRATHPLGDQQSLLVANALAQAQALMKERARRRARGILAKEGPVPRSTRRSPRRVAPAIARRRRS